MKHIPPTMSELTKFVESAHKHPFGGVVLIVVLALLIVALYVAKH